MARLTPNMSASLARIVYQLTDAPNLPVALLRIEQSYGSIMEVNKNSMTTAKTGGPVFIKSRTAFGFCSFGKGAYKGHAFIILRGTKFLGDWLTNLNVGTSRSAYGQSIHDGFHQAFQSMQLQIRPFINSLSANGIHSVHCVGHSLGGGMATICAEYVRALTSQRPYLYTFGAPRVGLRPFADILSSELGSERMFRVYHRTDIVPCIPFWPFVHAPTLLSDMYDYFQPSPGEFPSGEWHSMGRYISTVGKQNWSALRGKRNQHHTGENVESWLNKKEPISFNVTNLEWLDRAINYVLAKCLKGVGNTLTVAGANTFTLMDQLAYILIKGIDFSKDVSNLVLSLIRKIMVILGMKPVLEKADATKAFIHKIFLSLSSKVSAYCQRVLDDVLVNSQSV